jgi:NAD-dependent dihydropyrimidine dehydrogenase PreA subunit
MGVAKIDFNLCYSYNNYTCGTCYHACPMGAIRIGMWERPIVNEDACIGCGLCERSCIRYPQAIRVEATERSCDQTDLNATQDNSASDASRRVCESRDRKPDGLERVERAARRPADLRSQVAADMGRIGQPDEWLSRHCGDGALCDAVKDFRSCVRQNAGFLERPVRVLTNAASASVRVQSLWGADYAAVFAAWELFSP